MSNESFKLEVMSTFLSRIGQNIASLGASTPILVVGNTGAGKSSLIAYLQDNFRLEGRGRAQKVCLREETPGSPEIGFTMESKTKAPGVYLARGLEFCDTQGFADTEGLEIAAVAQVSAQLIIRASRGIRGIMIVTSVDKLYEEDGRWGTLRSLSYTLSKLLGSHSEDSVLFVFNRNITKESVADILEQIGRLEDQLNSKGDVRTDEDDALLFILDMMREENICLLDCETQASREEIFSKLAILSSLKRDQMPLNANVVTVPGFKEAISKAISIQEEQTRIIENEEMKIAEFLSLMEEDKQRREDKLKSQEQEEAILQKDPSPSSTLLALKMNLEEMESEYHELEESLRIGEGDLQEKEAEVAGTIQELSKSMESKKIEIEARIEHAQSEYERYQAELSCVRYNEDFHNNDETLRALHASKANMESELFVMKEKRATMEAPQEGSSLNAGFYQTVLELNGKIAEQEYLIKMFKSDLVNPPKNTKLSELKQILDILIFQKNVKQAELTILQAAVEEKNKKFLHKKISLDQELKNLQLTTKKNIQRKEKVIKECQGKLLSLPILEEISKLEGDAIKLKSEKEKTKEARAKKENEWTKLINEASSLEESIHLLSTDHAPVLRCKESSYDERRVHGWAFFRRVRQYQFSIMSDAQIDLRPIFPNGTEITNWEWASDLSVEKGTPAHWGERYTSRVQGGYHYKRTYYGPSHYYGSASVTLYAEKCNLPEQKQQIESKLQALEGVQGRIEGLRAEHERLNLRIEKLKGEIRKNSGELEDAKADQEKRQKSHIATLTSTKNKKEEEIAILKNTLAEKTNSIEAAKQALTVKIEKKQKALDDMQSGIDELAKKIEAMQLELEIGKLAESEEQAKFKNELAEKIMIAESRIQELKDVLQEEASKQEQATQEIALAKQALDKSIEKSQSDLEELTIKIFERQAELRGAERLKAEGLAKQLNDLTQEISREEQLIHIEIMNHEKQCEQLQRECVQKAESNQELKVKLDKLKQNIAQKQGEYEIEELKEEENQRKFRNFTVQRLEEIRLDLIGLDQKLSMYDKSCVDSQERIFEAQRRSQENLPLMEAVREIDRLLQFEHEFLREGIDHFNRLHPAGRVSTVLGTAFVESPRHPVDQDTDFHDAIASGSSAPAAGASRAYL